MKKSILPFLASLLTIAMAQPAAAEKKYGPGVTDTEIKLGQTFPYSGPASALSTTAKTELAYLAMINAKGGVNGRKINLISLDDALSPPKSVEQTRNLVESQGVFAIWGTMGSGPNLAIAKYLNAEKVPQLLVMAGSPKIFDPNLTWTTTLYMSLATEGNILMTYIRNTKPDAKIAIIYQNDETGKSYFEGAKAGLADKLSTMLVKELPFDLAVPTIDSQVLQAQAAGANVVYFATSAAKFAAQGIRKIGEIGGWKPQIVLPTGSAQKEATLKPAGFEHSVGVITQFFNKPADDPSFENDPAVKEYLAFMKEWAPNLPSHESSAEFGYIAAQFLVEIIKRCGDDLTRENLLYQATHVSDYQIPLFFPGIKLNITPEDRIPWKLGQIVRFDGERWVPIGGLASATK